MAFFICCLQPRLADFVFFFKGGDLVRLFHGQANIVQTIKQTILAERVHLKADLAAIGALDGLGCQIDRQGRVGAALGVIHQLVELFLRDLDRQDAVLEAVVVEDIGEAGGNDAADAEIQQRPGRVLTR